MTAERKPKGKKKSAGGAGGAPAAAGPSSELESYDSIESALGEPRRQPKRRAGSPSAADAKHGGAVGSRRCGGWPLCLLAVSLAVAVASSACFFYGDVVLDSLDEYGMNTVALRELYNSAVARHLVADESTPKHAASTSDGDQLPSGDSVLSSVDHLAAVNDQPAGRDEPEGDAAEPLVSDSPYDEVATDRNEEVAVGTSDDRLPDPAEAEGADGLSEAGEVFVPPLDELSPGDDDVVLSIGKATDDRWEPTERQLAAAGAAEEREPAAGGVPPLATTDVPLSSEYDLLAQDVPSGTVEPQTEGQQQQQDEQQPWQQDEQWQWQQDEQQQQRQDEQSQWQQDEQQQQQNEHQPWQQQDEQKQQQQQQQQQDEQQPWQQDEQWQWQQDEKQQQRQDEQSQWQQDEQQQQQNEQQPWQQQQQQQEENDRQQEQQQGVEQQQEQQEDEQQKVDDESPSPQQLPADDSDLSAADAEPAAAADAAYDAHGEQQRSDDASAPPADDGERAASPDGASYAGSDAAAETVSHLQTELKGEAGAHKMSNPKRVYAKRELTSSADNYIRLELDAGDDLVDQNALTEAKELFEKVLRRYPASPRAQYGLARSLDAQSEKEQSNSLLEAAIAAYEKLTQLPDVPEALHVRAAERLADRQQFRGWQSKAVSTLQRLVTRFPDRAELKNKLGVQLLLANKPHDAKLIFRQVLVKRPDDGFAKVHLGFILKTTDSDLAGAVPLLKEGIESGEPGVVDGRFFFHLGDAYQRLGRYEEASALYERGAEFGLFLSAWQRSLYNVDRLTARPWWTVAQLPPTYQAHLRMLEDHWETIRDEGLAQIDSSTGLFMPEDENLRKNGTWKQYTLYSQGRKHPSACIKAPKTCALIDTIPEAATCKRGQVKFSLMLPDTHIWPHCGPTNCRIRAHLGLLIPEGPRIRVQEETRSWVEGRFILFDDSFEHEVWHTGTEKRLVLIVDLWHPELTDYERRTMAAI